jgi:phage FluMu protein Com
MSTANSPAKIACPHCQGTMKSAGLAAGSKVNCPKCGKAFVLGGAPQPPPPLPSSPKPLPVFPPKAPQPPPASGGRQQATPAGPSSAPPATIAPRPAAPSQHLGPLDAVPADALSAAMATQPAHRPPKPDLLVDPNLLPPPKPKPKPKPTSITVVCRLCGTRMDAPLSKAGLTIQCPDCHTVNDINAPAPPKEEKKPAGPTLDDVPEFGMSDVVERPKYKPMVVPRGEDAVLGNLEGADHPPGWKPPQSAASDRGPVQVSASELQMSLPATPVEEEDGEEVVVSAPVDRIVIKPELPKTYLDPEPEEARLTDGRYNDDDMLGGGQVNSKSADAWKRAPFLYGLVEFLFYVSTLPSWIMLGVGAGVVLVLGNTALAFAQDPSPGTQLGAVLLSMLFSVTMGVFIAPFFGACLAIVQETANGVKEVQNWPDGNVTEWFFGSLYIPAAAFVAGLPGFALATFLLTGGMSLLFAPLPVVASWTILFPIVLFSMLAENSVLAVFSSRTKQSFNIAAEAWMLFYLYSMGLGVFGGAAAVLAGIPFWPATLVGGFALVTIAFLYCRVLGRMMWYADQKALKVSQQSPAA